MKELYTRRFVDNVMDISFTKYAIPSEKESLLQRLFRLNRVEYDREKVKDIVFAEYKSRGGYKSREYITDFIFAES